MKKILLPIVVVGLLINFLSLDNAVAATINIAEYANLGVGYGWIYQPSLHPGPWRLEVDSVAVRNGYNVFLIQEYDQNNFKNDQHFIGTDFSSGMYQVGVLNDYGQPSEEIAYRVPPTPKLLSDFIPGQDYSYSTTYWGSTLEVTINLVKEAVTVPAGFFPDTWKVIETFNHGSFTEIAWFANGMGMVKREQIDGNIWELTDYYGFTYTSSPVPIPGAVWLLGSGLVGLAGVRRRFQKG